MIRNNRTGKIIAAKVKSCKSIICKGTGLMFRKKPDYALVFIFNKEKIVPLTMFFVFYQIDVLFVSKELKVVEVKRRFKPFTNYTPQKKAKYIIELPDGWAKGTKAGDLLTVAIP